MFGDAGDMILDIVANQDNVDTWPLIKKFYGQDNEYAAYGNYYDAKQVVRSYLAEFGNEEDLLTNKDLLVGAVTVILKPDEKLAPDDVVIVALPVVLSVL